MWSIRTTLQLFIIACTLKCVFLQSLYNHGSASYRNQTWMSLFDDGIPLRKMSIVGSHSSMSTGAWGDAFQTQGSSLQVQLKAGYRALDIRCRHQNNKFRIHQRLIDLGINLDGVLNSVKNFLTSYPSQTVLMHIVEEYNPTGNSRSFEDTYIMYRDMFPDLIWTLTTQNPTLGMTRGKVVIIQDFVGAIHGLMYGSFTTIEHKRYSTNWDQYDRWVDIKNFIRTTNDAGSSRISFWTGSVGSFPYFVASGKSSPGNSAPRLATGLTTPGFRSYYPDFPRVACFIGICTIAFEGINTLGYNYITSNNFQYLGIIFTDFLGDTFLQYTIQRNSDLFGTCTNAQKSEGCTVCTTSGLCMACNTQKNYIFDDVTDSCKAAPGYYLNLPSDPGLCIDVMPGCLECSSQSICTLCDTYINYQLILGNCEAADGYYLDASSIPVACQIVGCYLCSSASICTNCSSANNFIMDANGDCVCDTANNFMLQGSSCVCISGFFLNETQCSSIPLCPDANSGCSVCSSSVCSICDTANNFVIDSPYCVCDVGYFFDGDQCGLCNATQPACQSCLSQTLCTQCIDNFTLIEGSCQCQVQYYQHDSDTCLSCSIGCLDCTSLHSCIKCDTASFFKLVGGICECQQGKFVQNPIDEVCVPCGAIPGCLSCDMNGCIQCDDIFGFTLNGTQCFCDFGEYVSVMNICTQCRIEGCLDCDAQTNCVLCDESKYYLEENLGQCLEICGDGILFNLECDDGNTIDGDGCSSDCKVETDYTCSGGSSMTPSACSFSGVIAIQILEFKKNPVKNQVTTKILLSPSLKAFQHINFEECLVTNFPYTSRETIYDPDSNQISFIFTYDKSLNTQQMELQLDPPDTLQFFYTKPAKLSMPYTTDNNLALKAYPQSVYTQVPQAQTTLQVLLYFSLVLFILALFFSSKLIGVEMMEILQFAYLGLILMDKLEALMYPFVTLWPVNGYNIVFEDSLTNMVPRRVSTPGYKSWFIANFSINFVLCILPLIIGIIVYFVSRCSKRQSEEQLLEASFDINVKKPNNLRKTAFKIMKEWQLTLLLFIQFHLTASICFGIKYGVDEIGGICGGIIISVGLIIMAVLLYKRPLNFGEYKQFFQINNLIRYNFYIWVIIWRMGLVVGICLLNQQEACCYFAIAMTVIQTIILIVVRPYKSNIRPIINSIFMIVIATIYTTYRLIIIDDTQWVTTYLPLILTAILFLSVIFNMVCLILHTLRSCKSNKKGLGSQDTSRELENIEIQLNIINKQQMDQLRTISPHGAQFSDNPHIQLLKSLKLDMQSQKIHTPKQKEAYRQQYDAI